jgi:hypothetical protein
LSNEGSTSIRCTKEQEADSFIASAFCKLNKNQTKIQKQMKENQTKMQEQINENETKIQEI